MGDPGGGCGPSAACCPTILAQRPRSIAESFNGAERWAALCQVIMWKEQCFRSVYVTRLPNITSFMSGTDADFKPRQCLSALVLVFAAGAAPRADRANGTARLNGTFIEFSPFSMAVQPS